MPRKRNKGKARKAKAKEEVKEKSGTAKECEEVEIAEQLGLDEASQIAKEVSRMILVDALPQGREEMSEAKQEFLAKCISTMPEEQQRSVHQKLGGIITENKEAQRKAAMTMLGFSDEQQALMDKVFANNPEFRERQTKMAIRDVKLGLAAVGAAKQVETLFTNQVKNDGECMHGFSDFSNRGAYEIIRMYFHEFLGKEQGNVQKALFATMPQYANCWGNIGTISMVQSYFLWLGTDKILNEKESSYTSNMCAYIVRYIEQHIEILHLRADPFGDFSNYEKTVNLWLANCHDLITANDRALVSFFRKRIPCKCLDEKNEETKKQTKSSSCYNEKCKFNFHRVEKSKTMCCSRCRSAHYCSRDCQVADWPRHKKYCQEIKNE